MTTGLAESNGSLPLGDDLKVTRGLTACTVGLAPGPTTLTSKENFTFTLLVFRIVKVNLVTAAALIRCLV